MMSLFEMMQKSQNGEAYRQLAQQFGLDSEQTEKALEALMPAFSSGLKRNDLSQQSLAGLVGCSIRTISTATKTRSCRTTRACGSTTGSATGASGWRPG